MELQEICSQIVAGTDGLKGCLLLDLETGLPLAQAAKPGADLPTEQVVADALRIFRGALVGHFARAVSPPRELSGFVEEAQLTTAEEQQFMANVPSWPGALLVLVAGKALRVGIGWMCAREASQRFAAARREGPARSADVAGPATGPSAVEPVAAVDPATSRDPLETTFRGEANSAATRTVTESSGVHPARDPEPPLLGPEAQLPATPRGQPETPQQGSPETPHAGLPETPSAGLPETPSAGLPETPHAGLPETPSVDLTEPPRVNLTEPPRAARGRAPSIRARRSIPMAQLLHEPTPTESGDSPAESDGGSGSQSSDVGRLGARASLLTRNKRR